MTIIEQPATAGSVAPASRAPGRRIGPYIIPAMLGLNGLAMLALGPLWYAMVPGVTATGPYNGHFVADIGVAFVAAAVSLLMGLLSLPHARLFALPAAVFLIGHALVHVTGIVHHGLPADLLAIATDVIAIYLPAWIAWRVVRPALPTLASSVRPPAILVEAGIRAAERRLGVKMDYARDIARAAPATFGKLQQLSMLHHDGRNEPALLHLAGLAAAMHDDCGECVQIHVNLARADGVPASWLRAALNGRLDELPAPLADACRFGRAVAADDPDMAAYRVRLEQHYGPATMAALAFEIGMARFYPTLKRGLGVARSCALVKVEVGDA